MGKLDITTSSESGSQSVIGIPKKADTRSRHSVLLLSFKSPRAQAGVFFVWKQADALLDLACCFLLRPKVAAIDLIH